MKALYVENRGQWREWLEANAEREGQVWLVGYKKHTGLASVAYEDAVEEAICFGWIDGKIKKLDEARFARRFTPRKTRSEWSRINIQRARKMARQGKMTAAGLRVFNPRHQTPGHPTKLPAALENEFRKQKSAWENFVRFPPSYKRITIGWVASAKREETQLRRLRQLVAASGAGRRIKFM